jgi:hypothetical protein
MKVATNNTIKFLVSLLIFSPLLNEYPPVMLWQPPVGMVGPFVS